MLPHDARFRRAPTQPVNSWGRTEDRPKIWNLVYLMNGRSLLYKRYPRSLIIPLSFIPLRSLHLRRSCATSSPSSRSSLVPCSHLRRHLLSHHRPPFPVYTNAQLKIPPTTLSLRMLNPATPSTANTERATAYTSRFVVYPTKLCISSLTIKF